MSGAKSGTSTTAATRPTRLELTTSAPIAMASGSPAATNDPNVISRITAAAISPIISVLPLGCFCELHRPSAESDLQAVALGVLGGGQQPLGVLDRHVVGVGDIEVDPCDQRPTVRRDRGRRWRTDPPPPRRGACPPAGRGAPRPGSRPRDWLTSSARTTTSTRSPDCAGNRSSSRVCACSESEPGKRGAVDEISPERSRQTDGEAEPQEPGEEHHPRRRKAQTCQPSQRSRPRPDGTSWRSSGRYCRSWGLRGGSQRSRSSRRPGAGPSVRRTATVYAVRRRRARRRTALLVVVTRAPGGVSRRGRTTYDHDMQDRAAPFRLPALAQDVLLALFVTVMQVQGTGRRSVGSGSGVACCDP